MQFAESKEEIKYYAPCDEKAWQRILRDIQTSAFPLCRKGVLPENGEKEDADKGPDFSVGYMPAPNRNPLKVCLVDPLEAYCSVSFKYGYVVVRTPRQKGRDDQEGITAYLRKVTLSKGGIVCATNVKGPLFRLDDGVSEAKIRAKEALLAASAELEAVYRDSVPIRVGARK